MWGAKLVNCSSVKSLPQIIYVDKDKCANCHACIAVCPVKICNDGSGDYVNLNPNTCIVCGRCLTACTHGARYFTDDFSQFLDATTRHEKLIAIVAPSAAANFPGQFLRLNGWLKSLGVEAVFDVSFGAELCAKSYADYIECRQPRAVIAQPCPAIVTYIEVHHPELLEYLAPIDSPMLYTMKMIRRHYPEYAGHRIAAISPCPAKKREFEAAGLGDFNVTYASILNYLEADGTQLDNFVETPYTNPSPRAGVLFPMPGGLMRTLEQWLPEISGRTRTIQGQDSVFRYLASLAETIRNSPESAPLLIDCLSCTYGCNCGPGTKASEQKIDAIEHCMIERQTQSLKNGGMGDAGFVVMQQTLEKFWTSDTYAKQYADLSANNHLRQPSEEERQVILASMHKYSEKDQFNCCSCGYGSCIDMTTAIFNGLNRPENCHHYLAIERENSRKQLERYQDHLEQLVAERTNELQATNQQLQAEIQEREHVEDELNNSETKLLEVLRGFPIPQFVINQDHKVCYWNKSLEQLSGISAEKIIGTSNHWQAFYPEAQPCLCDLLIADDLDAVSPRYEETCKKSALLDGVYEGEDFFPACGSAGKWLHFTGAAIRDASGSIVGAIQTVEDATERRRTEIALAASQQASEAANRAKSEFLANMSHEIRTPMTAIMGYLDLLAEQYAKNNAASHFAENDPISIVTKNAQHLLQIIDDVLDISKIEVGRLAVERIACSPCRILADVVSLMKVRSDVKRLALNVEFSGAIPETIQSDPTRLRQILLNLIGNAVKFTNTGGVRIVAGIEQSELGPVLQIKIIDTGIGMSKETLHELFQPFTQADASTSRKFGGTGLGLAISRRLAQLLGGDIAAESQLSAGSTFTFSTPTGSLNGVPMCNNPGDIFSRDAALPVTAARIHLPACRILLAEDGPDNQQLFSLLIRNAGGEVVVAANGRDAIELAITSKVQGKPFDVILMDMQMPILDGYSAVRQLRFEGWQGPIVALTAHAMADDRQRCREAGCDDYMSKPIERQLFLQLIAKHLHAKHEMLEQENAV